MMSAIKKFNLVNRSEDGEEAETLTFSRHELSTNNIDQDEIADVGLNISLEINPDAYEEDDVHYELFLIKPFLKNVSQETKSKTNFMHILSSITDTKEIRDLADWLHKQADEIDEELSVFEE
jgi:hypothetical protein